MLTNKTAFLRILALTALCVPASLANSCGKSKDFADSTASSPPKVESKTTLAPQETSVPEKKTSKKAAKNVILFVGDGMGVSTVTAARIFDGQSQGKMGEEHYLAFEHFDNVALIKTYNTNSQVPDSAGTATAIMSGYKTNIGAVNVPANLINERSPKTCKPKALPPTLAKIASESGRSVGIISTARITHATPAAVFGHAANRGWEADKDIEGMVKLAGCKSLAAQLVNPDTPVNLALGGGSKEFSEKQTAKWADQGEDHIYIETGTDFMALDPNAKQDVLGLFDKSHMDYEADRLEKGDEPSLSEMTSFAIDNLSARDDKGYVLMVEAGRVDHAHHGTNAYRAMRDMQALNEAVKTAIEKTGDDTLIMVTADHSHVFTIAGYPARGNPILGLVRGVDSKTGEVSPDPVLAEDGKPYTTLGYQNGPNAREEDSPALTDNMVQAKDFRQQTGVRTNSESHAGEDVPLYATGPGADRVRGVMEQNEIHGVMMKAMGIVK